MSHETAARDICNKLDKAHLGDTVTALNRMPEAIQQAVLPQLDEMLADSLHRAIEQTLEAGEPLGKHEIGRVLNSAKLQSLGYATYLSVMPWHLAQRSDELMQQLVQALQDGIRLENVRDIFAATGAINLFVAARDTDDQSSYMRAAAALVARLPAAHVVLDAEVAGQYGTDLNQVATSLGLRGCHIDLSTREACAHHSGMSVRGMRAIFIDTAGKQFNPRGAAAPANERGLSRGRPAGDGVTEEAVAEAPVATAPSSQASDRLSAIRARQARAAAGRRAA